MVSQSGVVGLLIVTLKRGEGDFLVTASKTSSGSPNCSSSGSKHKNSVSSLGIKPASAEAAQLLMYS